MSRPANYYEFLDDDSNEKKGPVAQQQKPKTQTTTQAKGTTQQARAPAKPADNRKPREEGGRFADQSVSDRKQRGERKPKGGEFTEVRAPRNPNQRQYDRKSGTGRGRENKRAGGGRGNWGAVTDETKTEEVEKTETTEAPVEAVATEGAPATEEVKVEEEEEKVKTLDEYLNSVKKVNIALPAPRQAGEGQEENAKWATYTALKRDDEEEEKKAEKKKAEAKESSKQTVSADQFIHFKESPKGGFRGGRGGRGGRREGGSPRGSPRGGRGGSRRGGSGARAPGLTEENFPALKA